MLIAFRIDSMKSYEEKLEEYLKKKEEKKKYRQENRIRMTRKELRENNWAKHLRKQRRVQNKRYYRKHKEDVKARTLRNYIQYRSESDPGYIYIPDGPYRRKHTTEVYCDWCDKHYRMNTYVLRKHEHNFCCQRCRVLWRAAQGRAVMQYNAMLRRLERERLQEIPFNFQIVFCIKGNQNKCFDKFYDRKEALHAWSEIVEKNKEIHIPRKFLTNGSEVDYELLLLHRDVEVNMFPNEYGKLIPHYVNSDSQNWNILNKTPYHIEERYYVDDILHTGKDIADNIFAYEKGVVVEMLLYRKWLLIKVDSVVKVIKASHKDAVYQLINYLNEHYRPHRHPLLLFVGDIEKSKKLTEHYLPFIQSSENNKV